MTAADQDHNNTHLSRTELRSLAATAAPFCVSIYMPTHRAGPEVQQEPIRLRNLLAEAERRLTAAGMRAADARELVAPADTLVPRHNFWQHRGEGLAVFLAPDLFRFYRLPHPADELVVIGRRFHLKRLLPLLAPDGRFYILGLSQSRVRLLEGTRHTVRELDVAGLPQSLADALRFDEPETNVQYHATVRGSVRGGGERPGSFHGQGAGQDEAKTNILRYFHQVDDGLRDWLGPSNAPLVLAGVEYLHPLYREANTYPRLVGESILGNPDDLRPEDLHHRAWEIVRPIFIAQREAAAALFRRLDGSADPMASSDLKTIVPAAHFGRVETLFVQLGTRQWGAFDPETGEVGMHPEPDPADEDLYDLAAVQTYLNGGTVFAVTADKMPTAAPVAAIFRF